MLKDGGFKYTGRDAAPDPVFYSGQAAIGFGSSAGRADIVKNAKFRYAEALLPTDPQIDPHPINSIIGGASLWTMTAPHRTPADYKAVVQLLPVHGWARGQAADYAKATGYVPVTIAGDGVLKQQGYYAGNPGTELPVGQPAERPDHGELARAAARPAAGNPQHHLRGSRRGPARPADGAAGDGQRDAARQPGAALVPRKIGSRLTDRA